MGYTLKRITALILSFMLTTMVVSSAVLPTAMAAEEYYIMFKNAKDKITTTIVENSTIHIESKLPAGYRFNDPPFSVMGTSGTMGDQYFEINEYNNTHSLEAKDGSAGGTGFDPKRDASATYVLKPNLLASISESIGTASIRVLGISGDLSSQSRGIDVKRSKPIEIIEPSHFKLVVEEDESDNPSVPLKFKELEAANVSGGVFNKCIGERPIDRSSVRGPDGTRSIRVSLGPKDGDAIYSFDVKLESTDRIKAGTTFEIYYNLQAVNSLTLTVVTPRRVLDSVRTAINTAPTSPNVADGTNAYVITNDELSAIHNNFNLLQQVATFNDPLDSKTTPKVSVDWEWVPDNPIYKNAITLGNETTKIKSATVIPQMNQVTGYLLATPKYKLIDGSFLPITDIPELTAPRVPLIVLGQGSLPKLKPIYKMVPYLNAATGQYELKEVPTVLMPEKLNVYSRNSTGDASEVGAQLEFGKELGRAEKVVITSTAPDILELFINNANIPYQYGSEYLNASPTGGVVPVKFIPKGSGDVGLTFTFYFKDAAGKLVPSKDTVKVKFQIVDSTPMDFAEFSNIKLTSKNLLNINSDVSAAYPNGEIKYGFDTEKTMYEISIPNRVTEFTVSPTLPINKGVSSKVEYRVEGVKVPLRGVLDLNDPNNNKLDVTDYPLGDSFSVILTAEAQSGTKRDYRLTITRRRNDNDSLLKSYSIKDVKSTELLNNFVSTTYSYDIEVPYSTRWVKPSNKTASLWSTAVTPGLVDKDGITNPLPAGDWLRLTYPTDPTAGFAGSKTTVLKTEVTAEDNTKTTYTFNISRKDPSTNDKASVVTLKNKNGDELAFTGDVKFDKEVRQYDMRIPYSLKDMTVEVTPDDAASTKVEVKTSKATKSLATNTSGKPLVFRFEEADIPSPVEKTFELTVGVYSESGAAPVPYVIKVTRNEPDNDTMLTSLKVQDQEKNPITSFSFNPQTTDYTVNVGYKVEAVTIIPTTRSPLARVEIDNVKLDKDITQHTVELKPGETKTVSVRIYPENLLADPAYREYRLTLTRALPSSDARLISLVVNGGEEFSPKFEAGKTVYSVTMPEGTTSITITAAPKDKAATLLINGEAATAGQPSAAIVPIEAQTEIPILVTAEDGKTTMTYTVKVTDRNLVPKSTNADLESLIVNYGDMSPRFKPSITEYEVAVKNDTASVDIMPVPAVEGSKVEVFMGTRKLGDYSSNYSAKLEDGENDFSVKVTPEDTKQSAKTYNIMVYRKDEEKQGKYKPLTADMVDYEKEGDIIVDITKYPIISAEVFNTLKTDFPDKNMIFEGNDYSLTLRGKDLEKLVPHEELFDLSLTFTSPLEEEIWDVILNDYRNNKVDPVFIHFNHHGALPAPMLLTLSLGRQYRNMSATWNYYNEERERIDFYGGVKTNSRGTFSLKLTHMSTYIFSDYQIVGAENKSGSNTVAGGVTSGITSGIDSGKLNPNTGAH